MDWLVNEVCVIAIALSLPLFLAHSDSHFDFILNSVAMLFVIELDDVDGLQLGNEEDFEGYKKDHPEAMDPEKERAERLAMGRHDPRENDVDAGKPSGGDSSPSSPLDRSAPPQEA